MLPKIMESLLNNANCIVVATPNVKVGSFGRIELLGRLIIKKTARTMFRLFSPEKSDSILGYLAFPKDVIDDIFSLDKIGYSLSVEKLVKNS